MSENLGEFFSLIGKAKKEKEDEFRSLVGDVDINSMFSQVKVSIEEDKKKKEKEEKQIKALESWLFAEQKKKEEVETIEVTESPIVGEDETNYEEWIEEEVKEREEEVTSEVVEETEEEEVEDTVDHALKILETIKSKEEVRENLGDPEILKIRRELEYLKNLVNAQGGGGEVNLKYLDDVSISDVENHDVLVYNSATEKWENEVGVQRLILDARNNTGSTLSPGTPVYQTGYNSGQDRINIATSDASDSNTMPAKGVVCDAIDNNSNGFIVVSGELEGVDTSAFNVADELYVAAGGGLTATRPSGGTELVQKIATVLRKSAGNGAILVHGAGRTNDVPNTISIGGSITAGTFYGDGSNLTGISGGAGAGAGGTWADGSAGISTTKNVGIGTTAKLGFALDVEGSARITGILTVGRSTITLNPNTDIVTVGTGITLDASNNKILVNGNEVADSSGNANYSGIITATTLSATTGNFSGNVSVAGTLTYEDVTNIDSVGIVTARSGVFFGSPTVSAIITNSATTTTESQTSIDSFSASTYRSAKYQVQITRGSEYQVTEISIVHDGSYSYGTEYATLKTGATLSTFSTDISGGNVRLLATPSSSTSTVFKFTKTAIVV